MQPLASWAKRAVPRLVQEVVLRAAHRRPGAGALGGPPKLRRAISGANAAMRPTIKCASHARARAPPSVVPEGRPLAGCVCSVRA